MKVCYPPTITLPLPVLKHSGPTKSPNLEIGILFANTLEEPIDSANAYGGFGIQPCGVCNLPTVRHCILLTKTVGEPEGKFVGGYGGCPVVTSIIALPQGGI